MTELQAVAGTQAVLKPLGFRKRRHAWNRDVGEFVDVVHFQVSKGLESFWVNLGVVDRRARELTWPDRGLSFFGDAECTIRRRLDAPLSSGGRYWNRGDPAASTEIPRLLVSLGLAFLEQMHDRGRIEAALQADNAIVRYRFPPDAIALALYSHLRGDHDAACTELDKVLPRSYGPSGWHERIDAVRREIGCQS
jgi:Domain of unknown function (DUF4304)